MNDDDDFPYAFPKPDCNEMHGQTGMTLRDFFAAAALQGYFAAPNTPHQVDHREVARYCYAQADFMLVERGA